MRRRLSLTAALVLLLSLLCACAAQHAQEMDENGYELYFLSDPNSAGGGDAIRAQEKRLVLDGAMETKDCVRALLEALLAGPDEPSLSSPIPEGTALKSLKVSGRRAQIDLSAQYARLTGIDLSLADYCITLTLTQLPDVARVRITVAGRELDYRSRQVFLARDILTVPKEDVVGTVDTSLYFVNGDGALTAEARTLNLYEGDTQVSAVVRALENGPETKGLSGVLPEGFKVRKVWLEEEICYVSLSSALLEGQPEPETLSQAVLALEQSLLSLESVEEVRFLVDGELADTYGPIDLP